ncbi:unnamed protein product [Hanseniaspora opuntiae]
MSDINSPPVPSVNTTNIKFLGKIRLPSNSLNPGNSSQAASKAYELFILFGMLLINIFIKVYSNFIILSFTREMMYNSKFAVDNHEEMINLSNLQNFNGGNIFMVFYKTKIEYTYELMKWRSYTLLKDCFY